MDIITYVESEKITEKRYTTTPSELHSRLMGKAKPQHAAFPEKNSGLLKKSNSIVRKKNRIQKILLPLIAFFLIAFTTLFVIWKLTDSVIKKIEFYQTSDVSNAMREYLFPESTLPVDKNQIAEIPDVISIVSFKDYTVGKGDTVSGIAYKFGLKKMGTILAINEIGNAKRLVPGQKLVIPSIDGMLHVVKSGESLSGIATKYDMPLTTLLDTNDLSEEMVQPGQKIFIPGASMSTFALRKALGELFIYPLRGRLTSPFGYRRDPFTGFRSFHTGIDLATRSGTPVKSVLDGRVAEVGYNRVYGNYIIITHDGGYQSFYAHLSKIYIKRGQRVIQGKRIAAVGNTGRSTGPHLHLSIYKHGKLINPLSVLTK